MGSISQASIDGFSKSAFYDTHRPSYSTEAAELLLNKLGVVGGDGLRILDLGAGTGKFTEILAQRPERFNIMAVEPHDDMAAVLRERQLFNVQIRSGEARKIPAEDQSFDAVIAAQSFHWFAEAEALQEIYRVLLPGGTLGMIWNIEDYNAPKSWRPSSAWEARLKDITWASGNDANRVRHEKWREVFEKQLETTPFAILTAANPLFTLPVGEDSVPFSHWLSPSALWDRYSTLSQFAVLKDKGLETLQNTVQRAITGDDIERNDRGELLIHGQTLLAWTSAVPGGP